MYLRQDFFEDDSAWAESDRQTTIVHEALHLLFSEGHLEIARKLGLTRAPDGSALTERNAIDAIDNYLEGDCVAR